MNDDKSLTGKILIAMPGMTDPRFTRALVLVCAHGDEGAMGLVVNRPLDELQFPELLGQLGIDTTADMRQVPVHFGGPVEPGRGFVLHRATGDEAQVEGRMNIANSNLAMTSTRDILEDLARGQGPAQAVLSLGYAGWGPGQLESEILSNGWLTADAADDMLFGDDNGHKWQAALKSLGIDPVMLSSTAGHA